MNKRSGTALSILTAFALIVSACSGGAGNGTEGDSGASSNQTPAPAAQAAPTEISIFLNQQTPEVLPPDNPIVKEIEKKTNTKLNILWTPQNTLPEKTKITLSSGDIPDLMLIASVTDSLFVQMAKQGAFWEIGPYLEQYPNLAALPQEILDNTKTQGKHYGLPRVRPLDGGGGMPMVRKDWLDKLGLKVPETMDDMYAVMKAFTENDPDGNGQADTVGLTGQVNPDNMGNLMWVEEVFNHTYGSWRLKDGKLTPNVFEKGTRDALGWLANAYQDKIIAPDFAIMKFSQSRDLLMGNKAGILGSAVNPQWLFTKEIRKIDPNGDMLPLPYMISGEGTKIAFKDSGNLGMFVIPKTVSEEKMKKILEFMDYGYSDEGSDLALYGLKDVHFTETDGFKVATEQAAKDMVGQNVLGQLYGKFEKYQRAFLTGIPKDLYDRNVQIIDQRAEVSIPSPEQGLISDTNSKVGPDYLKKIQDMKTKVILGKETLEGWDAFVAELKADSTYMKIVDEMNEAYQNK